MSEYVNGLSININDTVRVDFKDQYNTNINDIASIVMNYDTFKMIAQTFNTVIEDHDAKLAKIVEDKRLAN